MFFKVVNFACYRVKYIAIVISYSVRGYFFFCRVFRFYVFGFVFIGFVVFGVFGITIYFIFIDRSIEDFGGFFIFILFVLGLINCVFYRLEGGLFCLFLGIK